VRVIRRAPGVRGLGAGTTGPMNGLEFHRILQRSAERHAHAVLVNLRIRGQEKEQPPRETLGIKVHPLTARDRVD